MDEYWVCQHCRSLNRASSGRCYSCGNKFGSKPKETPPIRRDQPPPSALTGALPQTSFGVRSNPAPTEPPAYLSTPVAVQSQPYLTERPPARRFSRLSSPLAPIERRVSAALAVRPVISVAGVGYATAVLLALVFVTAGLVSLAGLHAATYALQNADLPGGWNQLTATQHGLIETLSIALVCLSLAMLILFSVFVGLSTHNIAGLGAEVTLLTQGSGATAWPRVVWVHIRLGVGVLLPTLLVWYGYLLPGLVVAVVVVEIAQRHVDDMLDWLDRPARHLPDLYRKMGPEGAKTSILASLWAALFRTANLALAATFLIVPAALTVDVTMKATSHQLDLWHTSGYGPGQLVLAAVLVVLAVSTALCLLATIGMVLGLVARQRTRRTMARVARSRSWLARPGEGTYGAAAQGAGAAGAAVAGAAVAGAAAAQGAGPAGAGAAFGTTPGGAAAFGAGYAGAGFGGTGFGGAGYGGAGYGGAVNSFDEDRFVDRYPPGAAPGLSEEDTFSARVAQARQALSGAGTAQSTTAQPASGPSALPPSWQGTQPPSWQGTQPPSWQGTQPPEPAQQHERWPRPQAGGLLRKIGARANSAQSGPADALDQASLNSPSTTSSPESPDVPEPSEPSEPPSA